MPSSIAAARSGQNIRRTYSLVNDIKTTTGPTAAATRPSAYASGGGATSGKSSQTAAPSHPKNSKLYKTELCRTWMDSGRCNYGEKCQYAHGEQERRPVSRHPKYKTEFCQPFHQDGYCPYGPRCNFIHNEEQPPASMLQTTKTGRIHSTCNGNIKQSNGLSSGGGSGGGGGCVNGICKPTTTSAAASTTTLTFGIWQPYYSGSSAGESPVPSSAGSSSNSPIGSTSPGLDFDENTGSFVVNTSSWNGFGSKVTNNLSRFNWPTTAAAVATSRAKPLIAQQQQQQQQPLLDPILINNLLELTIDENLDTKKVVTKAASDGGVTVASTNNVTTSSGRLPVFAQLSNPSSTAS